MCRRNQLWGWMLIAFGLGVLICLCISSHFFKCCMGTAGIVGGFFMLRKK